MQPFAMLVRSVQMPAAANTAKSVKTRLVSYTD